MNEKSLKKVFNLVWSLTISRHVASDLLLDSFGKRIWSVLKISKIFLKHLYEMKYRKTSPELPLKLKENLKTPQLNNRKTG